MFILQLNDMRDLLTIAANVVQAPTEQAILDFISRELVTPYFDEARINGESKVFRKVFRKGGPLEWYNHPEFSHSTFPPIVDVGTKDTFVARAQRQAYDEAGQKWDDCIVSLPTIPDNVKE